MYLWHTCKAPFGLFFPIAFTPPRTISLVTTLLTERVFCRFCMPRGRCDPGIVWAPGSSRVGSSATWRCPPPSRLPSPWARPQPRPPRIPPQTRPLPPAANTKQLDANKQAWKESAITEYKRSCQGWKRQINLFLFPQHRIWPLFKKRHSVLWICPLWTMGIFVPLKTRRATASFGLWTTPNNTILSYSVTRRKTHRNQDQQCQGCYR